jgi:hypothetical protein
MPAHSKRVIRRTEMLLNVMARDREEREEWLRPIKT